MTQMTQMTQNPEPGRRVQNAGAIVIGSFGSRIWL